MTKQTGGFPPRLGWIPLGIALAVVTVASMATFIPQYATQQVIGVSSANGGTTDNNGGGATGGTTGTQGTAGHTVTNGGPANNVSGGPTAVPKAGDCAHGHNAGATDAGVTATTIHIATTTVTTGIGSGFLGQAVSGMKGAINAVNRAGGICGRQITLESVNDNWDRTAGATDINNYISLGNTFALVGEPDSEGLDA